MPLPRLSCLLACIGTSFLMSTASAQSPAASFNLPQFYDFYNLQHMMLGNLSEQDCMRLDSDTCLKLGLRQLTNGTHTAERKTLWITASTRITEMLDAGFTTDPGIHETAPGIYSDSNKRPALAAFARWHIAADKQMKFALAYNSSTPKFEQHELSRWQGDTSTGTSALSAMLEVNTLVPMQFGLIQPYLQTSYRQIKQYNYTATDTTEIALASTAVQSGFRTIYVLHDRLQLAMNLSVEHDLMQHMRLYRHYPHYTDLHHTDGRNMHALRFNISAGGRFIFADNAELTLLISRYSQPFGSEMGTGAALYYLLRL